MFYLCCAVSLLYSIIQEGCQEGHGGLRKNPIGILRLHQLHKMVVSSKISLLNPGSERSMTKFSREINIIKDLAYQAGDAVLEIYKREYEVVEKGD